MDAETLIDLIRKRRDKLRSLADDIVSPECTPGQMANTLTVLIDELEESLIADTPHVVRKGNP